METSIESKVINHLGLVAGMCDTLEIVSQIDNKIKQDAVQRNISIGTIVKSLILNGLGFAQRSLYMVSHFFEDKPVSLLLGEGIESSYLNDTVIGRALDDLYQYGTTKLYAELSAHSILKLNLSNPFVHLDSTSFHLDGKYNSEEDGKDLTVVHLTKGYSRDHRPELNQVMLNLIVENQAGIPMHMEVLNGNSSDKITFRETIVKHIKNLQLAHGFSYTIADSALYTSDNLPIITKLTHWISRVPETIKEAQEIIAITPYCDMQELKENYRYISLCSTYSGIRQRWLLIWSEDAYKREMISLNKNYRKQGEKEIANFIRLCGENFNCPTDAQIAYNKFKSTCKYIYLQDFKLNEVPKYNTKGRPAKGAIPTHIVYSIEAVVCSDIEHYRSHQQTKGKFIIATDELEENQLSDIEIFNAYKDQGKVERGFRFLKDPQFAASTFFVEKPERVEALLMIMTLCLMVYASLEYQIRSQLEVTKTTIPNQLAKSTQKPTMRWIFQLFKGIHILFVKNEHPMCLNIKELHKTILNLMGTQYQKYYLLL